MQATVHELGPDGGGHLVTDQGELLAFDAEVLAASALRSLRPGQRLTVDLGGEPVRVVAIRLGSVGERDGGPHRS